MEADVPVLCLVLSSPDKMSVYEWGGGWWATLTSSAWAKIWSCRDVASSLGTVTMKMRASQSLYLSSSLDGGLFPQTIHSAMCYSALKKRQQWVQSPPVLWTIKNSQYEFKISHLLINYFLYTLFLFCMLWINTLTHFWGIFLCCLPVKKQKNMNLNNPSNGVTLVLTHISKDKSVRLCFTRNHSVAVELLRKVISLASGSSTSTNRKPVIWVQRESFLGTGGLQKTKGLVAFALHVLRLLLPCPFFCSKSIPAFFCFPLSSVIFSSHRVFLPCF